MYCDMIISNVCFASRSSLLMVGQLPRVVIGLPLLWVTLCDINFSWKTAESLGNFGSGFDSCRFNDTIFQYLTSVLDFQYPYRLSAML